MPTACSFRQTDEKHVSVEVEKMLWSPKMDLIAVSNKLGQVVLHRLSWQKVWTLPPPGEGINVTALVWRPDGKVVGVGYSDGQILLCNVENCQILHDLQVKGQVTSLSWVNRYTIERDDSTEENGEKSEVYRDSSEIFLPKLSPITKSYGAISKEQSEDIVEDSKKLKDQSELNILVIGSDASLIEMFAFGIFPVGSIDLVSKLDIKAGKVIAASLSDDLYLLSVILETIEEDDWCSYTLHTFESTILASRHEELKALALKFGQIITLLGYLDATVKQMVESWEDVLIELDAKLAKFAQEKYKLSETSISNDFLELLMFGTPSPELQAFLLHDLGDKGLKKLATIETSYTNIQKLVLKHLHSVGQAICYHLTDVRGMSHWYDRFGVLGLSTQTVQDAINCVGSFMMKVLELQQVIDKNLKTFKAFFRWLGVSIKRMSEEGIPPELATTSKMTVQDINFVAEFLTENLSEEATGKGENFKLEKVGQYLKDEDLSHPVDSSDNPWVKFLAQSSHVKDSPLLYPMYPEKSLIQMKHLLEVRIDSALRNTAAVIGQSLQCTGVFKLYRHRTRVEKGVKPLCPGASQFCVPEDDGRMYQYTLFHSSPRPCDVLYLARQASTKDGLSQLEMTSLKFEHMGPEHGNTSTEFSRCDDHSVVDYSKYDNKMISVLLQEKSQDQLPLIVQVPIEKIIQKQFHIHASGTGDYAVERATGAQDAGAYIDHMNIRTLENMKVHSFSVSGSRKVACMLFSSRRRVRLFVMDVEDEEDEDDPELIHETTDQSQDSQHQDGISDENKENTSTIDESV